MSRRGRRKRKRAKIDIPLKLEVLRYLDTHSSTETISYFKERTKIYPNYLTKWAKQRESFERFEELMKAKKRRKIRFRVEGAGRKKVYTTENPKIEGLLNKLKELRRNKTKVSKGSFQRKLTGVMGPSDNPKQRSWYARKQLGFKQKKKKQKTFQHKEKSELRPIVYKFTDAVENISNSSRKLIVLNADEVGVPILNPCKTTLTFEESDDGNFLDSTSGKKQHTVTPVIGIYCARGRISKAFKVALNVIFKGNKSTSKRSRYFGKVPPVPKFWMDRLRTLNWKQRDELKDVQVFQTASGRTNRPIYAALIKLSVIKSYAVVATHTGKTMSAVKKIPLQIRQDSYAHHGDSDETTIFEELYEELFDLGYENVSVHHVIPGFTEQSQPLDICFNANFKYQYYKKADDYQEAPTLTKKKNLKMPNAKKLLLWYKRSFDEVPEPVVKRSFQKAGFYPSDRTRLAYHKLKSFCDESDSDDDSEEEELSD